MDVAFSKAFFGCQSIARNVIKDRFQSALRGNSGHLDFQIMTGAVSADRIPMYDESKARGRSNGAGVYSSAYRANDIPSVFDEIIARHYKEIQRYLGKHFLYEEPLFFRTLNMPLALETYDVYSNVWHQDSHDGDRLLKIFVCLMDVNADDGPFMFLDRAATLRHWAVLAERWTFEKIGAVPYFPEQQYAVGSKGSYFILNTATCMHRASIPREYRDMMQITLYPSWRKAADRKVYAGIDTDNSH